MSHLFVMGLSSALTNVSRIIIACKSNVYHHCSQNATRITCTWSLEPGVHARGESLVRRPFRAALQFLLPLAA